MKTALLLLSSALLLSACEGAKYTSRDSQQKPNSQTPAGESKSDSTANTILKTEFFATNSDATPAYAIATGSMGTQVFAISAAKDSEGEMNWAPATLDKDLAANAVPVSKRRFLQVLNHVADNSKRFFTSDDVCEVVLGAKCEEVAVPKMTRAIPMQCSFTVDGKSYPLALSYSGLAYGKKQMFIVMEQADGTKVVKTFLDDRANYTAQLQMMKDLVVTKTHESIEQAVNKTFWQRLFSNELFVKMRAEKNLVSFFGSFYTVDATFYSDTEGKLKLSSSRAEMNEFIDQADLKSNEDSHFNEYINYIRKDGSVGQTSLRADCLAL